MKRKIRFLLPLVLLFVMVMACSAFAKPKLSAKSITIYKFESPKWLDNGKLSMTKKRADYWADYGNIKVTGVSKNAKVSCNSKDISVEGTYWTFGYYKNKYTISAGLKEDPETFEQIKVKPGKYPVTVKIRDGENEYSYKISVYVREYQPRCISYLKVGSKKYTAPFKKKNAGYIAMKLPKGKKKITYSCPKGFYKNYLNFTVYRKGKKAGNYKNGSVATIKKGDIIQLEYAWKTWAKGGQFTIKVK